MPIDFPTSPTNGQVYTVGSKSWTWNSANATWNATSVTTGPQGTTGTQGLTGLQGTVGLQGTTGGFSFTLGTNVQTFLTTPSSANLASALTDETGTGAAVFATSPTLVTPSIGNAKYGFSSSTGATTVASGTRDYIFTGSLAATFTLPAVGIGIVGYDHYISNAGTAILTINLSTGVELTKLAPGEDTILTGLGGSWAIFVPQDMPDKNMIIMGAY